jgi:hypothetical protein
MANWPGTVLPPNATVTNRAPIDLTRVAASYSGKGNCMMKGRPCRHRSRAGGRQLAWRW